MTSTSLDVQFIVETKCIPLFDIEAFDGGRGAKATCELAGHRFAFVAQPTQNGERQ